MIRLSKDKVLEDYFIDVNGVITDKDGIIQEIKIYNKRLYFKGKPIHCIMMYTFYGYKKGFDIHHIDGNKQNNKLENLVYITHSEHVIIHNKNRILSEETKHKIGKANKGKHHSEEAKKKMSNSHKGIKRKPHSEETKHKISESHKGKIGIQTRGFLGKHHSEETKSKMSEARKEYWANKNK